MSTLEVGDLKAHIRYGEIIILVDARQTTNRPLVLDLEEAMALADWINEVIPRG